MRIPARYRKDELIGLILEAQARHVRAKRMQGTLDERREGLRFLQRPTEVKSKTMTRTERTDTSVFTGRFAESPLKTKLRSGAVAMSRLPLIRSVLRAHAVRDALHTLPGFRVLYPAVGYETAHPFDRAHGTDTSGYASATKLPPSQHASSESCFHYWGSQPSWVRLVLANLPAPETFTFIDLGCGKGRSLLAASEFPFRDIVGVELSPSLATIARKNADIIAKRFERRTRVHVEERDACTYEFPSGDIVLFLYNPFGEVVLSQVVARLEEALAAERRDIYVVYFTPCFAACIDASPRFKRSLEATAPSVPEERGYCDPADGSFVIWKSV